MTIPVFQKKVWAYYKKHGRHDLPWRKTKDPYKILVSEVMLQQTQVARVIPKYEAFLKAFPNVQALAKASPQAVLKLWSGLGYNRRALYLKRAAEAVAREYKGVFPKEAEELEKLGGIGPYTARAVATFSHDMPYVCIETNIRTVFLHEFYPKSKDVSDKKLIPLIEQSLPKKQFRQWYWALMDYGTYLKKSIPNPSRASAHHTKQSTFEGSVRQMRGYIEREVSRSSKTSTALKNVLPKKDHVRFDTALTGLVRDGLVVQTKTGRVTISKH